MQIQARDRLRAPEVGTGRRRFRFAGHPSSPDKAVSGATRPFREGNPDSNRSRDAKLEFLICITRP